MAFRRIYCKNSLVKRTVSLLTLSLFGNILPVISLVMAYVFCILICTISCNSPNNSTPSMIKSQSHNRNNYIDSQTRNWWCRVLTLLICFYLFLQQKSLGLTYKNFWGALVIFWVKKQHFYVIQYDYEKHL